MRAVRAILTLLLVWALALTPALAGPALPLARQAEHLCCLDAEHAPEPALEVEPEPEAAEHACCAAPDAAQPPPRPIEGDPPCEDPCGNCFFCPALRPLMQASAADVAPGATAPRTVLVSAPELCPPSLSLTPTPPPPRS